MQYIYNYVTEFLFKTEEKLSALLFFIKITCICVCIYLRICVSVQYSHSDAQEYA